MNADLIFIGKQFAQGEQWTTLCDALASKLMAAGNTLAAVLCYICAGNVDRTVEIWSRSLANERDGRSYAELLQVCITFYVSRINFAGLLRSYFSALIL